MSTLEKIRAEIAELDDADYDYEGYYKAVTDALQIIDKYAEQEPADTWSIKDVADTFKKHGLIREQEPCDVFDEYGNYKYPSDVELTEPNTATSMPCDDVISREDKVEPQESEDKG